jgi:hypothetical protein
MFFGLIFHGIYSEPVKRILLGSHPVPSSNPHKADVLVKVPSGCTLLGLSFSKLKTIA